MSEPIRIYDLHASPNSMKVRIALNFKGLPFELVPVDPNDRSEVVRISGQPLTPVLQHGSTVQFDSASILRYLDANFPSTHRLFSADYAEMKQIEKWETFGRREMYEPVSLIFGQFFSERKESAVIERASALLTDRTAEIETALGEGDWLVGGRMTAADVTIAPVVHYGMLPDVPDPNPIYRFFAEGLRLGPGRDRTRAWVRRVMAWDR